MSFLDFFRKKEGKENAAADSSASFVPMTAASDSDSPDTAAPLPGVNDAGNATTTDSSGSFFGGDGGGGGGGDGGGS
ncbi:MAG: hypothetical protein V4681_03190 [Patescibacteria group bacterium]